MIGESGAAERPGGITSESVRRARESAVPEPGWREGKSMFFANFQVQLEI